MIKSFLTLSATALLLSACAVGGGFSKISRIDHTGYYTPEQVRALTSGGMPTVFYGPEDVRNQPERYASGVRTPGWMAEAPE